jgi:hypothetical protein
MNWSITARMYEYWQSAALPQRRTVPGKIAWEVSFIGGFTDDVRTRPKNMNLWARFRERNLPLAVATVWACLVSQRRGKNRDSLHGKDVSGRYRVRV